MSVRTWVRRPVTWVVVAIVVLAGAGVGLALFQPWKLWVDQTVDEAAPAAASAPAAPPNAAPPGTAPPAGAPSPATPPAAGPRVLARGTFVSQEHETGGKVVILQLADGSRVLRLENLDTSNGPDLHVWITDAAVQAGAAGWRVFDDGRYTALGKLKGNKGSQNYAVPAGLDLARYRSVSIWCDRFNVSFGAAELTAT
jgi:Electron transfer DM13